MRLFGAEVELRRLEGGAEGRGRCVPVGPLAVAQVRQRVCVLSLGHVYLQRHLLLPCLVVTVGLIMLVLLVLLPAELPSSVKRQIPLLAGRLEVEGTRTHCIGRLLLAAVAVEVSPLLLAGLQRRDEAQLLEVVLVHALVVLGGILAKEPVHARYGRQVEWSRWWRQMERAVLHWAAALLLVLLVSVRWAGAVGAVVAASLGSMARWLSFAMHLVLLHHFDVVPLHHLEEVGWELVQVWHTRMIQHVSLQTGREARVGLVQELQVA